MEQQIELTVLPNGIDSHGGSPSLRLSVFVSPRLLPGPGQNDTYVDLTGTAFEDWPRYAGGMRLEVLFNGQAAPATPVPQEPDSRLWHALFDGVKAKLRARTLLLKVARDVEQVPVTSYSIRKVTSAVTDLYAATMQQTVSRLKSADDGLPDIEYLKSFDSFGNTYSEQSLGLDDGDHTEYFLPTDREALFRQAWQLHNPEVPNFPTPPTTVRPSTPTFSPLPMSILDRTADPDAPNVEFHDRVFFLGDFPDVVRTLGLVFELRVPFSGSIPLTGGISVRASNMGPATPILHTTEYFIDPGKQTFAPTTKSGSDLRDGMLKLDDDAEYTVVQVDPDGAVLKAIDFTRNLHRISASKALDAPRVAAPPSLRSVGLSVAKESRARRVKEAAATTRSLREDVENKKRAVFFADDLVRGYRIEVWESNGGNGVWRSLCARKVELTSGGVSAPALDDEGWVTLGVTDRAIDNGTSQQRIAHQSLFRWDGWSLVAPRPGKEVPDDGEPKPDPVSDLRVTVVPKPGSLPVLRYGKKYRIRARAVDLAGNDMSRGHRAPDDFTSASASATYRRFEPVGSPAIVARTEIPASAGESVSQAVVRTFATGATDGPSERHVAPPRAAQGLAETHGKFDGAYGPMKASYDAILAHDGDFREDGAPHSEPQLKLPYLADPLATGVAIDGFPGAQSFLSVQFSGSWPDVLPFRLSLTAGAEGMKFDERSRVLTVGLSPARIVTLSFSSTLRAGELDLLGMWAWGLEKQVSLDRDDAIAGRYWMLTPARSVTLMHAVQRPLLDPTFRPRPEPGDIPFVAQKEHFGETFAAVTGRFFLNVESTSRVELVAAWNEPIDDVTMERPQVVAPTAQVLEHILDYPASPAADPGAQAAVEFSTRHELGDTKYRRIQYRAVATTRFREQFGTTDAGKSEEPRSPEANAAEHALLTRETPEGERPTRHILNSARPDALEILYIVPTFGWTPVTKTKDKPSKTDTLSRERKGGGLRVYIKRPWFSSGDGEMLGAIVWPDAEAFFAYEATNSRQSLLKLATPSGEVPPLLKPLISQWGLDPIWKTVSTLRPLAISDFLNATPYGVAAGAPRYTLGELEATSEGGTRLMTVAAFVPQFDEVRRLWYCDVEMATHGAYYPFVRLALARFQPNSVRETVGGVPRDCSLSRVLLADFVQLAPGRTATITFKHKDDRDVTVAVRGTGYVESSMGAERSIVDITVEERADRRAVGWVAVPLSTVRLVPKSTGAGDELLWQGALKLPDEREKGHYRLVIREYESHNTDRGKTRRLVYADAIEI